MALKNESRKTIYHPSLAYSGKGICPPPTPEFAANLTIATNVLIEAAGMFPEGHGVNIVIITGSTQDDSPIEMAGSSPCQNGQVLLVGAVGMNIPCKTVLSE